MSSLILLKSMLYAKALQRKTKVVKKKIKKKPIRTTEAIKYMCRICDQEEGDVPIFDNIVQPNIPEDILQFTGVTMDKTDGLSKYMCQTCLQLLKGCIAFKEICQKTNKKLIKMAIKKESNVEFSDPDKHGDSSDDLLEEYSNVNNSESMEDHYSKAKLNLKKYKRSKNQPKQNDNEDSSKKLRFLCDVCGKQSHSNANLLAHLLIHEPIFPFKCEQCPYMGRTIDLLKVHQRTHLTVKPYKCPQCNKATTTSSNLAKHIRHVHNSNKPHKCTYCEKSFAFEHDLKRHIKDIHLRQGTVECYICFKKFNTRKILRGHQWKVHKIKGEKQGRLPSYLKWQMDEQNENHNNIPDNEAEPRFLT